MRLLRVFIAYWMSRLGPGLLLGGTLVIGVAAAYLLIGRPMDQRLIYLQTHLADMRAQMTQRRPAWTPEAPEVAAHAFYRTLPAQKAIPDLLEQIFDAAFESNLEVRQGTLKLEVDTDAPMQRYRIELPVVGNYAGIRGFANRILKDLPSASLDDIRFSRDDVKSADVAATVRLTLYLRKP